jgi:hypothetical protein
VHGAVKLLYMLWVPCARQHVVGTWYRKHWCASAPWHCSMALLHGIAPWHCSMALLHGIASWHCSMASIWACHAGPVAAHEHGAPVPAQAFSLCFLLRRASRASNTQMCRQQALPTQQAILQTRGSSAQCRLDLGMQRQKGANSQKNTRGQEGSSSSGRMQDTATAVAAVAAAAAC